MFDVEFKELFLVGEGKAHLEWMHRTIQ